MRLEFFLHEIVSPWVHRAIQRRGLAKSRCLLRAIAHHGGTDCYVVNKFTVPGLASGRGKI